MYIQYTYNVHTIYIQCTYNVHTVYIQCTYSVHAVYLLVKYCRLLINSKFECVSTKNDKEIVNICKLNQI